jgi:hypothetical protein
MGFFYSFSFSISLGVAIMSRTEMFSFTIYKETYVRNYSPVTVDTQTFCPALETHEVESRAAQFLCFYTNYIKLTSSLAVISVLFSLFSSPRHFNRFFLNLVFFGSTPNVLYLNFLAHAESVRFLLY